MLDELNEIFMEVKDEELTYENLPDGEYLGKVIGAEYKMSKTDKPMVMFSFELLKEIIKVENIISVCYYLVKMNLL